jgi:hypothetical protein
MRKAGVKNRIALCVHAIHHSLVSGQKEGFPLLMPLGDNSTPLL